MCTECEREVDEARAGLELLIQAERETMRVLAGDTQAQHTIRLACCIVDAYHDSGHDIKPVALGFALTIQKLLAVQQIYGIPTV